MIEILEHSRKCYGTVGQFHAPTKMCLIEYKKNQVVSLRVLSSRKLKKGEMVFGKLDKEGPIVLHLVRDSHKVRLAAFVQGHSPKEDQAPVNMVSGGSP